MTIQELTKEMPNFVRAMGWYEINSQRPQTLRNLAVSLNLEASEVLEHFQWNETPIDPEALASELADVALYLLQLASLSGIDLEQAIITKLKVNYQRTWETVSPSSIGTSETNISADEPHTSPAPLR